MTDISSASVELLLSCLMDKQNSALALYASVSLFAFDYFLTFPNEVRHVWTTTNQTTPNLVLFLASRYLGLISCIMSVQRWSVPVAFLTTGIRMGTILASECILGARTWAIWNRSWWVLGVLVVAGLTGTALAADAIHKLSNIETAYLWNDLTTQLNIPPECRTVTSFVGVRWVLPYILTILFEIITASLTFSRILWWRMRLPDSSKIPLLDTLWKDGVLYFFFMIVAGIVNVMIVANSSSLHAKRSVSQMQSVLHSMLSTRIMLHLASSGERSKAQVAVTARISNAVQFTSIFVESQDYQGEELEVP